MAESRPKRARAAPVAAPGAKRVTLTGVMAVPDDFKRIRVLLVDRLRGARAADASWATLRDEVPASEGFGVPYSLHAPDAEGVRGEFWAVAPAHTQKHWLQVAEQLRGLEVRVEVTLRGYSYAGQGEAGPRGTSFVISLIEEVTR